MSELSTAQAKQTTPPEVGAKADLKLQRKCACGQHTFGGHACDDCKKKQSKVQRWATDRPTPMAVLHEHGFAESAAMASTGPGFDLSRVRATAPALRTLPRLQRAPRDGEASSEPLPAEQVDVSLPEGAPAPSPAPPRAVPGPEGVSPEPTPSPEPAPETTPEPGPAAAASTRPATLLTDDTATDLEPGQLRKSELIDQLQTAVCAEAEAALAGTEHSTTGCPYLAFWFGYYRRQSAESIEQTLREYLPQARRVGTASDYVPLIAARVRQSVEHWVRTGEVTGVPEGAPRLAAARAAPAETSAEAPGTVQLRVAFPSLSAEEQIESAELADFQRRPKVAGIVFGESVGRLALPREMLTPEYLSDEDDELSLESDEFIPRSPETTASSDPSADTVHRSQTAASSPVAVQAELGDGSPLDSGVRTRMESALGAGLSHVRVHTDATATRLSSALHARAFTVGEHVAFGAGEYRPGSLLGDALIAHELAHVIQQNGSAASTARMSMEEARYSDSALERDADRAAVGAVASLWADGQGAGATVAGRAGPLLASGLRLQRCGDCSASGRSTSSNTIVCDGSGGIKVKVTESSLGGAQGVKCGLVDCATQHEQSHRRDTLAICPDVCKGEEEGTQIKLSTSERAKQEVKASNVEIACLEGHLSRHKKAGDATCQTMVEDRIKQMEKYRDGFK